MSEVTLLLEAIDSGDRQAASQLLPVVYTELRRLAATKIAREAPGQTLQATALVHEAWLRLAGVGTDKPQWAGRAHFFGAAAEAMRRILIDNARRKKAVRHGGGLQREDVDNPLLQIAATCDNDDELLAVHEALDELARHDARKAQVVKLRYFVGFSVEETAEALGISIPTVNRDWAYARAWLYREIGRERNRETNAVPRLP